MRHYVILGALLMILSGIGLYLYANRIQSVTIALYSDGRKQSVRSTLPQDSTLESQIQRLFSNSSNGSYEALSKYELISSGVAIEVMYRTPVRLNLYNPAIAQHVAIVDRILIKLSGKFQGWILYGNGAYDSGPLITTDTTTVHSVMTLVK
jgi:hypothetical protein